MLKKYRVSAGLSQEELAHRSGLSVRGISDLERGIKARPHLETVRMLADALNLPEDERPGFFAAARPDTPLLRPDQPTPAWAELPVPLTPLVGREQAARDIVQLLRDGHARLLTLTGPGGIGKTRLAQRVAGDLAEAFPEGVIFVPLASVANPDLVLPTIAQALGVREEPGQELIDLLRAAIGGQRLLLVLDNLEHLRPAAPSIGQLVQALPGITLLVTSRAPLRLRGERLFPVPPLSLPEGQQPADPMELERYAAVQLFVQRVRAARPDFELTPTNAALVAEICERLDGLPLAIELAAARMRVLSLTVLQELLGARLRILKGGPLDAPARHQSLSAAISSSFDLLDEEDQALLLRLAHFSGGCTLDAAEAVAGAGDIYAMLEGLETLTDEGLLTRTERSNGQVRFGMLESIREFAQSQMPEEVASDIRNRHARYYRDLAERAEAELARPHRTQWMARLEDEYPNLRAALGWTIASGDSETAYRLGSALWPFWAATGRLNEGHSWLHRATNVSGDAAPEARAGALLRLGNLAVDLASYDEAKTRYEASLAIRRQLNDELGMAGALSGLGLVAWNQGKYAEAREALEQALALWQAHNHQRGIALTLMNLGNIAIAEGDYQTASTAHRESLRLRELAGDLAGAGYSLFWLGQLARLEGRGAEARAYFCRSLRTFHETGDRLGFAYALHEMGALAIDQRRLRHALAYERRALALRRELGDVQGTIDCIEGIATVACARGDLESGLLLLAAADSWRNARTAPAIPLIRQRNREIMDSARSTFSEDDLQRIWTTGSTLRIDEAARHALTITP
jgi:predicted ATPase/transcriptional regulator with XRE-family HTH domain